MRTRTSRTHSRRAASPSCAGKLNANRGQRLVKPESLELSLVLLDSRVAPDLERGLGDAGLAAAAAAATAPAADTASALGVRSRGSARLERRG
jgi:hypothetical protein